MVHITSIGGEGSTIDCVDTRGHDIRGSSQCRQSGLRCMGIAKEKCCDRIGSSDLGLNRQTVDHAVAKTEQIVRDKCAAREQKCSAADQHIHPGQFGSNRIVTGSEHFVTPEVRDLSLR